MAPRLLLFTTNYPFAYNGGEVMFVAPEMPALASRFDRVTVVPLHQGGGQCTMPSGCELDLGLAKRWPAWHWYLCALRWPGFWRETWRAVLGGGAVGLARVWRWSAVAAATWDYLRSNPAMGASLLYTYWRGGQALAATRWVSNQCGTTAISRVHGYDLYLERFSPPFQPWLSLYAGLDLVLPVSKHGADYLRALGVTHSRVSRLGVAAGARCAMSDDATWRVVSCGRLDLLKQFHRCARVLVALARAHPGNRVEWTHFGDGPQRARVDAELRHSPTNLAVRLAGQVANQSVLDHYATHPVDVHLLLSDSEGLPVSIQEALAHGVPVIARDVGGVSEAVARNGSNGVLLPADVDDVGVVRALEKVLGAPACERRALRDAAWNHWSKWFDANNNHAQLADDLLLLCGARAQ